MRRNLSTRLSVRFYFAPKLLLLTVCAFYLFHFPQTWLTSSIYISVHVLFPLLHVYMSIFPLSHCPSLPPVSIRHHSCQITPPPWPLLCCGGRSDQDRWSQMISGPYSFLQETAWYCCWHDALSGCPQVQECPHSTCQTVHFIFSLIFKFPTDIDTVLTFWTVGVSSHYDMNVNWHVQTPWSRILSTSY